MRTLQVCKPVHLVPALTSASGVAKQKKNSNENQIISKIKCLALQANWISKYLSERLIDAATDSNHTTSHASTLRRQRNAYTALLQTEMRQNFSSEHGTNAVQVSPGNSQVPCKRIPASGD